MSIVTSITYNICSVYIQTRTYAHEMTNVIQLIKIIISTYFFIIIVDQSSMDERGTTGIF